MRHELHEFSLSREPKAFRTFVLIRAIRVSLRLSYL